MEEPSKNVWIESIESDLEVLNISLSYANIKELSTYQFKNYVDKQTEEKALKHLNFIKLKYSKVLHIKHETLTLQDYFYPENIWNIQMSKFIFNARSRMLDLRSNFKQKYLKAGSKCALGCI